MARPLLGEEVVDRALVEQVELGAGPRRQPLVAPRRETAQQGRAHHAAVAGDVHRVVGFDHLYRIVRIVAASVGASAVRP
jgi:hypothetical protein